MSEYKVAGQGLRFMFVGSVIAALGWLHPIAPTLRGVASIVGALLVLYGLYQAMPAHSCYKLAMLMELAGAAVGVLRMIFKSGLLGDVVSIAGTVAALLSTAFVCTATGGLLETKGEAGLAGQAKLIVLLFGVCAAVSALCTLVSWIPLLNILAAITGAVTSVVMLAANVLKVIFYYKASAALLA